MNREKKRMPNPSLNHREVIPSQKVSNVGGVVKKGHFQRVCKPNNDREGKGKKKRLHVCHRQ